MNNNENNVSIFAIFFDLSRGKQALLSVSQPALGAILALGYLPDTQTLVIGITAAATGYFAVFSLNDVLDYKIDKQSLKAGKSEIPENDIDVTFLRHPLARGDISLVTSIVWVTVLAAISAALAYILNPICLTLFISCVILEVVYCSMRSFSWVKTFVSGIMVGIGGLAGWSAVAPLSPMALSYFLFLALWEIAGRNLPNDLADIDSDSSVGIQTVATIFGNRTSALATLVGAIATIMSVLILPMPLSIILATFAVGLWAMLVPATILARIPTSSQAAAYFNRASLYPALILVVVLASIFTRNL